MKHPELRQTKAAADGLTMLLIADGLDDHTFVNGLLAAPEQRRLLAVSSLADAIPEVLRGGLDVAMLDMHHVDRSTMALLATLHAVAPTLPIVVLCDEADEELDAELVALDVEEVLIRSDVTPALLRRSLRHAVLHRRHVAALEDRNRQLHHDACHDSLTGVLNLRGLRETFLALRRGELPTWSAMFVDCDNFKQINDEYGHMVGDRVLQRLAARMVELASDTGVVTRVGGDELLLLLPGTSAEQAEWVGRSLMTRLAEDSDSSEYAIPLVTLSVGIASYGRILPDLEQLLQASEEGMRESKRVGKNAITRRASPRSAGGVRPLAPDLRTMYQPIRRLVDGGIEGYEVFQRASSRDPAQLPEAGAGPGRKRQDLRSLAACMSAASARQLVGRLHFNVHPRTLCELGMGGLPQAIAQVAVGQQVCLEIDWLGASEELATLAQQMQAWRSLDIQIAIDGFELSTGALEALILLSPDLVKVRWPSLGRDAMPHARRIQALADQMGAELLFDELDSPGQLALAQEFGATSGQGRALGAARSLS